MITAYLIGDRQLIARLGKLPAAIEDDVARTVDALGHRLIDRVAHTKLSGQVLKRRTGKLAASIARGGADTLSRFERTATTAISYVGTNVKYGRVWEYGADVKAYTVRPVKAQALHFFVGGQEIFAKHANIPAHHIKARPFLAPALAEMKPLIITELTAALNRAAARVMRG
jgi:phage gpG-like protein